MPQEPKKRHSRARQGKRRASISLSVTDTKHKLTRFYAMLEKDKADKELATQKNKTLKTQNEEE